MGGPVNQRPSHQYMQQTLRTRKMARRLILDKEHVTLRAFQHWNQDFVHD